jgi:hypothetical protein
MWEPVDGNPVSREVVDETADNRDGLNWCSKPIARKGTKGRSFRRFHLSRVSILRDAVTLAVVWIAQERGQTETRCRASLWP